MQKPIVVLALSLAFGVQAFAAARSTFVDQAVETDRRAARRSIFQRCGRDFARHHLIDHVHHRN